MTSSKDKALELLKNTPLNELPEEMRVKVAELLEKEAINNARRTYKEFVKLMGPILIDGFVWGRHIEIICDKLQKHVEGIWKKEGVVNRFMLNLPPGGGKSQYCTRMLAAWCMGRWPHIRIIIVGHTLDLSRDEFVSKARDIMWMPEYKKIFPDTHLREDKQTQGRFLTTDGGECIAGSALSKLAGRRAHLIIADDILVESDALSKTVNRDFCDGYISNIRSRLLATPDGAELQIGTRFCDYDIFNYLLEADKNTGNDWDHMVIPAILDEDASALLRKDGDDESTYKPGTSYWPEFSPIKKLMSTKASLVNNISRWNSVYMQNPTAEEGELVAQKDFKRWKTMQAPECGLVVLTMDTAYTKNSQSDFTAYQIWGIFDYAGTSEFDDEVKVGHHRPNCILLDAKKGKWDYPELVALIEDLYERKSIDVILLEERSSGLALIPDLRNRGLPVQGWKSERDKLMRMQAAAPFIKSGLFWVPTPEERPDIGAKSLEFVSEITRFPGGKNDDHPDALSQFVLWARENNLLSAKGYQREAISAVASDEEEDDASFINSARGTYTAGL